MYNAEHSFVDEISFETDEGDGNHTVIIKVRHHDQKTQADKINADVYDAQGQAFQVQDDPFEPGADEEGRPKVTGDDDIGHEIYHGDGADIDGDHPIRPVTRRQHD